MGDTALKQLQIGLEDAFTAGANSVYNGGSPVAATRRLAVEQEPTFDFKPTFSTPKESRGTYAGVYTHLLELMEAAGKFSAAIYADDQVYFGKMAVSGAPTITSLPSSPTALLAATALGVSGNSLTTQPNAAGDGAAAKKLALTLSNASSTATAVVVTVTGTDVFGNPLTEQVNFSAGTTTPSKVGGGVGAMSCTLYTKNYFKTVNSQGITSSAQPSGDQIAVGGINAWLYYFLPDMIASTLYSVTGEYFDGSIAWQLPGLVIGKAGWQGTFGKEFKFTADAMVQQKKQLGSGARSALTVLSDNIMPGIPTKLGNLYADPLGSVAGTTAVPGRITDFKFDTDNGLKLIKAGDGTPNPSAVGRDYNGDKTTGELTLLTNSPTDPAELAQFLNQASRIARVAYPGLPLPCGALNTTGGWPAALQQGGKGGYYGMMFDLAGKWTDAGETKVDGRLAYKFTLESEVDLYSLLAHYALSVVSSLSPND